MALQLSVYWNKAPCLGDTWRTRGMYDLDVSGRQMVGFPPQSLYSGGVASGTHWRVSFRAGTAVLAVETLLSYRSVRGPVTTPTEQSFTGWERFLKAVPATGGRRLWCVGTVCWWPGATGRCAWIWPLPTAILLQIPYWLSWNWTHLPTMKKTRRLTRDLWHSLIMSWSISENVAFDYFGAPNVT